MAYLTRISHKLFAVTSNIFMSPALHLNSLLNILTNMPTSSVLRAPCIHEHPRGFATKSCEKSGLILAWRHENSLILHTTMLISADMINDEIRKGKRILSERCYDLPEHTLSLNHAISNNYGQSRKPGSMPL